MVETGNSVGAEEIAVFLAMAVTMGSGSIVAVGEKTTEVGKTMTGAVESS